MQIFHQLEALPEECRYGVVTLGNFDGVHRGHKAVLGRTFKAARMREAPLVVVTFEPHPTSVFQPNIAPFRLTPFCTKARYLADLAVDVLVTLQFDLEFSRVSALDFVRRVLVDGLAATHIIIGYDFAFGYKRQGNAALLKQLGKTHGFTVDVAKPVRESGSEIYSSSLIRKYLCAGDPRRAAQLLGRPWEMGGTVIPGSKLGRDLGFPTANLELGEYLRPKTGVYAVRAGIDAGETTQWLAGAANIGTRPTVDGTGLLLEVHMLDFSGDLYGQIIRVELMDYLRPEEKFDSLDEMRAQISIDCDRARQILGVS